MGLLLARLFKKAKHRTLIYSRDENKARRSAAKIHAEVGKVTDLAKANIVIVTVPIENIVEACRNALPHMRRNSLLVDISSVKTGVVDKVRELLPAGIEYLSLHPLFGPSLREMKGQNIIAIHAKPGPLSQRMIKALQAMGFRVTVSSIEEHDKAMAAMQVMHHYAYLVMALELEKAIRTDQRMVNFLTRSLKKTVNQLRSFRKINKTLLAIQNLNPYAPRARQAYARRAFEMMDLKPETISRIAAAMRGLERLTKLKDSRQMQS